MTTSPTQSGGCMEYGIIFVAILVVIVAIISILIVPASALGLFVLALQERSWLTITMAAIILILLFKWLMARKRVSELEAD